MNRIRKVDIFTPFIWKVTVLAIFITFGFSIVSNTVSFAQINVFDFCKCEDENANKIDCDDDAVAVRCNINDNSWVPFEMSTVRIDVNNELKDSGSSKEIGFFDSPVIIETWGAEGGNGSTKGGSTSNCSGGSKGGRGYARTALDYSFFTRTGVYIYLGDKGDSGANRTKQAGKGGSSTIVIGKQLELVSEPCIFSEGCTPESQRVYLIAGGGGGGGGCNNSCSVNNIDGRDGGRGACAVAVSGDSTDVDVPNSNCVIGTFGESVSATGNNGSNSDNTGRGGNPDLEDSGAECRAEGNSRNGKSGIGGRGGARNKDGNNYETWAKILTPSGKEEKLDEQTLSWMQGEGGTGDGSKAGAGGGGYGGACGGNTNNKNCAGVQYGQGGGGGGGGTYAVGATVSEEGFHLSVNKLNSVNGGQVGILIGLIDKDDTKIGKALEIIEEVFGEAHGLGSGPNAGSLEISAGFKLGENQIDLNQAGITIGAGLLDRDGNLIPSISGIELERSLEMEQASTGSTRALFESDTNSPDVAIELENTEGVLAMDLSAQNVEILESLQCAQAESTGIEFYMTLDDGINEPLLLELVGHWDCVANNEGLVDTLILRAEESTQDEDGTGTSNGGNCSIAGDSVGISSILVLFLIPFAVIIFTRVHRSINIKD